AIGGVALDLMATGNFIIPQSSLACFLEQRLLVDQVAELCQAMSGAKMIRCAGVSAIDAAGGGVIHECIGRRQHVRGGHGDQAALPVVEEKRRAQQHTDEQQDDALEHEASTQAQSDSCRSSSSSCSKRSLSISVASMSACKVISRSGTAWSGNVA